TVRRRDVAARFVVRREIVARLRLGAIANCSAPIGSAIFRFGAMTTRAALVSFARWRNFRGGGAALAGETNALAFIARISGARPRNPLGPGRVIARGGRRSLRGCGNAFAGETNAFAIIARRKGESRTI